MGHQNSSHRYVRWFVSSFLLVISQTQICENVKPKAMIQISHIHAHTHICIYIFIYIYMHSIYTFRERERESMHAWGVELWKVWFYKALHHYTCVNVVMHTCSLSFSISLSIYLSIYLSTYLYVYLYAYLHGYLCVYIYIYMIIYVKQLFVLFLGLLLYIPLRFWVRTARAYYWSFATVDSWTVGLSGNVWTQNMSTCHMSLYNQKCLHTSYTLRGTM